MPASGARALTYYAQQSDVTNPGRYADLFDGLPSDVRDLSRIVWGLVIHRVDATHQGIALSPERRAEADLRSVSRLLGRIVELDPRPLSEPRRPEQKLVGVCRDFAVLLCAILRHQGRPARPRAGFATYFAPNFHTDHWVCEYWHDDESRWAMVDANLPPDWTGDFDAMDVPSERFLNAGLAWRVCRAGQADAKTFGLAEIPEELGMGWIASQAVRDLASLNKRELLCWDTWALGHSSFLGYSADEARLLDCVADVTATADNERFDEIRALYNGDARLTVPADVWTFDSASDSRLPHIVQLH